LQGVKTGGPAGALTIEQATQTQVGEPASPCPHGVDVHPRLDGDTRVGPAPSRQEHDPRPHPVPVLGLVTGGGFLQSVPLGGGQD
jgi:hypothetical protein